VTREAAIAGVALVACFLLNGCVIVTPAFETPAPEDVPRLEADFARDPTDITTALSLAAARFETGDAEGGRDVLQATHAAVPGDLTVLAVLGIAEEVLGNYLTADAHYADFLEAAPHDPRAGAVQGRKDVIAPQALGIRAAAELSLTPTPAMWDATGDRLAVLPFHYDASVTGVAALATALSDLISVDFTRAGESVVDPGATRAMARAANVDPTSDLALADVMRFGGLHRANAVLSARIVTGADGAPSIRAILVTVPADADGRVSTVTPITVEGGDLLTLEKRLAVATLFAWRGRVDGRVAEAAVRREVTATDAVSAYGVGLTHSGAGRHAEAQVAYARAAALDPRFIRARQASERAAMANTLRSMPVGTSTADASRIGELQRAVFAVRSRSPAHARGIAHLGALDRGSTVAEVLGQDLLGGGTLFSFFLTLPGGGP